MKAQLFMTLLLICQIINGQENQFNAKNKISNIIEKINLKKEVNIYISDIETINEILTFSKSKYKIVYSFSNTCHFSFDAFPDLINFVAKNEYKFELFIIVSNRYDEINSIKKYFNNLKYFQPIFILDTEKYGNKKNPSSRNEKMISQLCDKCDKNKMGFSDIFILDTNGKTIYNSNYDIPWPKIFEEIQVLK